MDDTTQGILAVYDEKKDLYERFTAKLEVLVREILMEHGIEVHLVSARVKPRESLQKKLLRDQKYEQLEDVTDIAGIRITTHFADDVDRIGTIIQQEFDVDSKNSVDKRATLDADRFGYLSVHHVVALTSARGELTEYRPFPSLKAEIQTRSILQHAWAEIEHDLGYKAVDVPRPIRRRFSALAGLLELADREFCSIRHELLEYERAVAEKVSSEPETVPIEKASLEAFVYSSLLVRELDDHIARITGETVMFEYLHSSDHPALLGSFGVTTIGQLHALLLEQRAAITSFARGWLLGLPDEKRDDDEQGADDGGVMAGISIFYLLYILAARTGDAERIRKYLEDAGIAPEDDRATLAERILTEYEVKGEGIE